MCKNDFKCNYKFITKYRITLLTFNVHNWFSLYNYSPFVIYIQFDYCMEIVGGGEGRIPSNSTKIASIKCHMFILRNYEQGKFYLFIRYASQIFLVILKKKFQYYLCIIRPNQPLRNSFGSEWRNKFEFKYFFQLRIDSKKSFFFS